MKQRSVPTLIGALVIAFGAWLAAFDFRPIKKQLHSLDAWPEDDGGALVYAYAEGGADSGWPLLLSDPVASQPRGDAGTWGLMPDGTPVPPLPLSVARQVRFGVVLVSYAGAQPSAGGGHPSTRSRAEAQDFASRLALVAAHDFRAAVQQGDPGSAEDLGTVRLGVLESAPEYVLFTLPVDAVGGPVDTPRGYWIVKRLE